MAKYTKDPELNLLANKLKDIVWIDPLTREEDESLHELTVNREARRRLVVPLPTLVHWAVRIYLGGEQRTIGIVHYRDVNAAFRFADMAQQYFWKYRVRGCAPPSDRDLNLDKVRLDHDMAHEENALALLALMEKHLLSIGALKDTETRASEARQRKASRKNMSTIVRMNQIEINEKFDGLTRTIEGFTKQLSDIREEFAAFRNSPKATNALLEKLIDGWEKLTEVISAPPDYSPPVPHPLYPPPPVPAPSWPPQPSWAPTITCDAKPTNSH